jgi:hypothetical protein
MQRRRIATTEGTKESMGVPEVDAEWVAESIKKIEDRRAEERKHTTSSSKLEETLS